MIFYIGSMCALQYNYNYQLNGQDFYIHIICFLLSLSKFQFPLLTTLSCLFSSDAHKFQSTIP